MSLNDKIIAIMEQVQREKIHPYITQIPGVCGGSPIISGTRFTVSSIANYVFKLGFTPEELVLKFSNLSLAQVYDALSFYYDHKPEIDREVDSNSIEFCMKSFPELS